MPPKQQPDFGFAPVMASVVGQVGCLTVFLILIALGVGMLLDRLLGTNGIFAGIFILASIPVSLYLVMRVSLQSINRMQAKIEAQQNEAQNETQEELELESLAEDTENK